MSFNNMTCKFCNGKYHHCTGCNHDYQREEGYCSIDCYYKSKNEILRKIIELFSCLSDEYKDYIFELIKTENKEFINYIWEKQEE